MRIATGFGHSIYRQQRKRRAARFLREPTQPAAVKPRPAWPTRAEGRRTPLLLQTLAQSLRWRDFRPQALAHIQQQQVGAAVTDRALAESDPISAEEAAINRNLIASVAGLGLAATGTLFYLPLTWLSVPFIIYASVDVLRDAQNALITERKLRHSMLDATVIISALASRYYVASALASLTYYTGCKLIAMTEDSAQRTLARMMDEQPQVVWRLVNGAEVETPLTELQRGDIIVISTGDTLAADGYVVDGLAAVDQRLLSGEARPVEKEAGTPVFAGTTLLAGRLQVRVEKAGTDTVAAQIGEILLRTADYKSSLQARSEEISDRSVLPTLGLSALTLAAFGPASAVAVIGANYAEVLRVIAPLGMLNFLSLAAQQGILVKDGRALDLLNQVDTVVFDKTGTLTLELPHVTHVHTWDEIDGDELLALAAAAEQRQNHPLARAIIEAAQARNLSLPTIDDSSYEVGYGIKAVVETRQIRVGSLRFMALGGIPIDETVYTQQRLAHDHGSSLVYVALNGRLAGAIELNTSLRPEAQQIVEQLKARNFDLYIISGDQQEPTRRLATALGIENYVAEVLPEEKAAWVARLQAQGRFVCFVGDGINDAIALKQAQTSISLRGAATAATDTAQIVLTDESLVQLDQAFALARRFKKNMRNSYITTFGPGLLCLGGIFFFKFKLLSAMVCYNASLVAGLGNAILPALSSENYKPNGHEPFAQSRQIT